MYDPSKPSNKILIDAARTTHNHSQYITISEQGFFIRKFCLPVTEIDHTDGIGTKGYFHWKCRTFHNAVLDALAMNLNDLQMVRATPFKLQNHIFLPSEDTDAVSIIANVLAKECIKRKIVITGGECAIHEDMPGMEISITMSGFCDQPYPNTWSPNRAIIGLPSSGIHSNGFTYIRDMMNKYGSAYLSFKDEWLTPTRIYDLPNLPFCIYGIQHVTGGAYLKLKKRLRNVDAIIHRNHNLRPQEMFHEIYRCQRSDETMYSTLNCGIGMLLSVADKNVDKIIKDTGGVVIGETRPGDGKVFIESMFSNSVVTL